MRKISIVCPCFNEQEALPKFLQTIENLQTDFAELGLNLEVIVVDDDSRDGSRKLLRKVFLEVDYLRVLLNPINMGVYRSTYRGLRLCTGDLVVPMFPIDLQDSPDVLIAMVKHKIVTNKTAVMGQKKQRKEPFVLRSLRNIFYYLLQKCSRRPINRNMGEFGVVDFWVIKEILRKKDHYPFIRSMISSITSDIYLFEYVWQARVAGKSNFSFFDLYDHAMNAFVSNGLSLFRPMVLFGFSLGFLGFIFALFNVVLYIVSPSTFSTSGVATLIVLMCIFSGILIIMTGLVGEFVISISNQVRNTDQHITLSEMTKE